MDILKRIDPDSIVYAYYNENWGVSIYSYRKNNKPVHVRIKEMRQFEKYTIINGDVEENYESLFDIDMPCNKTFKLVKDCNDLYIEKNIII